MTSPSFPCATSALLTAALDGPVRAVTEVARTRVSVHYETDDVDLPVLSVCLPDAVRLPCAMVATTLPGNGEAALGDGRLRVGGRAWTPTRWWTPPRPTRLTPPRAERLVDLANGHVANAGADRSALGVALPPPTRTGLVPEALVGAGPGLTPSGDDVLAGALVAARAVGDPRHPIWALATHRLLAAGRTTAVSRALLHHAASGWATPELAQFVVALCTAPDETAVDSASTALLAVGHSSGAALAAGVLHTFSTYHLEGAA